MKVHCTCETNSWGEEEEEEEEEHNKHGQRTGKPPGNIFFEGNWFTFPVSVMLYFVVIVVSSN